MPPVRSLLRGLTKTAGALGGGAYGASTTPEGEDPTLRALGYGALGGVVGPQALSAARRGLSDFTFFSMLSSPDTIIRGNLGAIGGAAMAAMELGTEGLLTMNPAKLRDAARIVKSLMTEAAPTYAKAMRASPDEFSRMYQKVMPKPLKGSDKTMAEQHLEGVGIGRLFAAPDMAAVQAMRRGGLSADDAARYTLTGQPQSQLGSGILEHIRKGRKKGKLHDFVYTQSAPFARVGLLGMERGLQRTPVVGFLTDHLMQRGARRAADTVKGSLDAARKSRTDFDEAMAAFRDAANRGSSNDVLHGLRARAEALKKAAVRPKRLQKQEAAYEDALQRVRDVTPTRAQQISRQGLGGAAMGTAYQAAGSGGERDPRLDLVMGPAAGPAYLPYQIGREVRRQTERGQVNPLQVAGEVFKESSPFGFQPFGLFMNPETEIPRRFIPAGMADVAAATDPAFGRERSRSALERARESGSYTGPTHPLLAGAMSRIPGLRQQLPETFQPVDVFGRPRYATPQFMDSSPLAQGISKAVFPSFESAAPAPMNQRDPLMRQLTELGIKPNIPSANVSVPGLGVNMTHTPQSAASVQRYRGQAREMAARIVTQIPQLQQMPDSPQKRMLARLIMRRVQNRISQSMSSAALPLSMMQGATLPPVLREG
jgi:hypothetical protein